MIDEAILDYLVYTAIKALLEVPEASASAEDSAQVPLQMFTCVFKRRRRHLSPPSTLSITNPQQDSLAEDGKHHIRATSHVGELDRIDLRETLPLFLALSAAQNALQESTITEIWMRLAAGYMAQVYAEQVLLLHENRSGMLEDIFHWGFDSNLTAEEGSDARMVNEMFDADDDTINLWETIKEEHMRTLRPPPGTSLTAHLEAIVSSGLSISAFKEKVSEFLVGLLSAHQPPLLTQLERGKVQGLSRKSTAALKTQAGFV
ncbi:MAG: hypothetical protein Q9225_003191 [Loekoesia sp. 1 TL-2023]